MTDQTLFQENPEQEKTKPADQPQSLFTINDRAYDVESAKTKIENADSFIETLKKEKEDQEAQLKAYKEQNEQLSAQLSQSAKIEEALSMFNESQRQPTPQEQPKDATTSLDVEALRAQLSEEVFQKLQQQEQHKSQQANFQQAMKAAQTAYGDQMAAKLKARGEELGMDPTAIDQMAKSQPKAFNDLFLPKAPSARYTPDGTGGNKNESAANLEGVLENWNDRDKFWSSQAKATSLRDMEEKISKLVAEGKVNPNSKKLI